MIQEKMTKKKMANYFNEEQLEGLEGISVGYGRFYWASFQEFDLKSDHVVLMTLIQSLSKKRSFCFMSKPKLAEYINVSVPTVYRIIRDLTEKELLEFGEDKWFKGVVKMRPSPKWFELVERIEECYANKKTDEFYH